MSKSKGKSPSKTPAKTAAAKPKASDGVSVIDSTFAVEAAAALVGKKNAAPMGGSMRKESSTFKQLKDGINQPPLQSIGNVLDKTSSASAKKSSLPFNHASRQVGHNQTFGADANKTGVPRRTGG